MSKATELRIGNIIKYQNGGDLFHINSINEDGCDVYNRTETTWIEHWAFEGVELTPEILEKSGFIQPPHFTVQNSWYKDIGRNRTISIACVGTPNEIIFISEMEDNKVSNIIVARNYDYDGKTYLHQLQNIHFAITNQELTITL